MFPVGVLSVVYLDTIVRSVQAAKSCWGQPVIEGDIVAIDRVRLHYRGEAAVARVMGMGGPAQLQKTYPSGDREYKGTNEGQSKWIVSSAPSFLLSDVRRVYFQSDGAFGAVCLVLSCGLVKDCMTHDRAMLPDRL